ncbi:MAG: hypothetical protein ACHREM_26100 [Polyangiales bacterium]
MTTTRGLVMLSSVLFMGSVGACAQILGGPFDALEIAGTDAGDAWSVLDTNGPDEAIVGDASGPEAKAGCSISACSTTAQCASFCTSVPGQYVCCVSPGGESLSQCLYSSTPCAVDAGAVDAVVDTGAADVACAGCLQGSVCMPGTANDACGSDGAPCEVCPYFCEPPMQSPCTYGAPTYAPVCKNQKCDNASVPSCCLSCTSSGGSGC